MVLTRRSAVLGFVLGFVLLGGCSDSLFGAHRAGGGSGGGDDDGGVIGGVIGCAEPCNADATADFDGTLHGAHDRWRYLDDHRDRSWTPMAVGDQVMTGADPGNHITTCAAHPSAPACSSLPGALLVSSAGGASAADPAIELTVAAAQVIDLKIKAFVPTGQADQTIRLYRNSREDVLFTDKASAGVTLARVITLDALPGDRFLVAVAPIGSGATDVGLQLVSSASTATFPSECMLAVPFTSATGNTTQDLCGGPTFNYFAMNKTGKQPQLMPGVFPELGKAATISSGEYFQRGTTNLQVFQWPKEYTVQLWFRTGQLVNGQFNSMFADWDTSSCGGIGIDIIPAASPELHVHICKNLSTNLDADIVHLLDPGVGWQFIRVVRSNGTGSVCLNGSRVESVAFMTDQGGTNQLLSLGREDSQATTPAYFDGQIDDVRVISGALPCD